LWFYVLRRLILLVPTLIGLTLLVFALEHAGGPSVFLALYINPHLTGSARQQLVDQLTARFHLNDPIYVQYFYWLGAILQGDWGTSAQNGQAVTTNFVWFMPNTIMLTVVASLLTWVISIPLALLAGIIRILRVSMLEVLDQDYIRLARAKGVPERTVNNFHAKKNALLPTVTTFGYLVSGLFGGAVVIEEIFGFKGIGWWTTMAFLNSDIAVVMGSTLVFGIVLVLTTLILDILYGFLDPRIRYE